MNPLSQAAQYLVSTLFGLYIAAVLLRFLFQWRRADFYNPLSQALVKLTNPPLAPLRRWVPGYRGLDLAALVLAFALQAIETLLLLAIAGQQPGLPALVVLALAGLLGKVLYIFLASIILEAVLSFVTPDGRHPLGSLVQRLNAPLLAPVRRLLPPVAGLDFSPLVVIILLQLTRMLVVGPLEGLGVRLALG